MKIILTFLSVAAYLSVIGWAQCHLVPVDGSVLGVQERRENLGSVIKHYDAAAGAETIAAAVFFHAHLGRGVVAVRVVHAEGKHEARVLRVGADGRLGPEAIKPLGIAHANAIRKLWRQQILAIKAEDQEIILDAAPVLVMNKTLGRPWVIGQVSGGAETSEGLGLLIAVADILIRYVDNDATHDDHFIQVLENKLMPN